MWGLIVGLLIIITPIAGIILFLMLIGGIKIVMEYERGVKFTLGKYSGIMEPGLNYVFPMIQSWRRIDTRIVTLDIPGQDVMTKDNVPANINAVVYFRVNDAKKAVLNISDYKFAVAKYGQTSLRDVAGEVELDELLSQREEIASKLKEIVDNATDPWGIQVTDIKIQDVELPADLKRTIMRQAETEREKRALIIKAEGELIAAKNMSKAANMLTESQGGLHLRTLQTINSLSSDKSNTVVLAVPIEVLEAVASMRQKSKKPHSM